MRIVNDPFFPEGLPVPASHAIDRASAFSADATPSARRPEGTSGLPDALAMAKAFRRHWVLALALGFLGAAVAGGATWRFFPRPKYTASTLLEVKTQKPILLLETTQEKTDYRIFQSTQLALINSQLVLEAALARPGIGDLVTVRAQAKPVEWLQEELVAEFPSGSELLRINLSGARPADLSALVNAITAAYLDEIISKDENERVGSTAKLKNYLDEYNAKLAEKRARLRGMAESVGSDDRQTLTLKQQLAIQQLATERSELIAVQAELQRSAAELRVMRDTGAGQGPRPIDEELVDGALAREPALEPLERRAELVARKLESAKAVARNANDGAVRSLTRDHNAARRALADKRKELRPKVERQVRGEQEVDRDSLRFAELEKQTKVLAEREKDLTVEIGRLDKEAQAFNRQTIDIQWLKDEITQGEETARRIGKEIEALTVEQRAPNRVKVIEGPGNPKRESPKKRLAAVGLASAGSFFCAILGVCWREYRLRRVDHPDEVTDGLGLRLVGTLPALPDLGRAREECWQNLLVESVDAARTVILRDCRAGALRTIMVTSASKGEGKSSLSSHLAVSLSRTGRRTLLVDLDLRRPSLHRLFDLSVGPGVCELLRGEAEPYDVVRPVAPDLDLITAGHATPEAIRALGQDSLPNLLAVLSDRYDLVVIDSAPVLPVADSLLISQHVDAVLFSVYRDVSRLPAVYAGYERLAALGVRILGVVVTGVPARHYSAQYGYGEPALRGY